MVSKHQSELIKNSMNVLQKKYSRIDTTKIKFINHSRNIVVLENDKYLYRINLSTKNIERLKKRNVENIKFELLTDIYYDAYLLEKKHQRLNKK
jgi:hypothetical protein